MKFIILFSIFLTSCSTVRHDISKGIKEGAIYKRDMNICMDGKCSQGVIVVPKKEKYKFKIEAHGHLDLFTFSTCHREDTTEAHAKRNWWGRSNKKVEGTFSPVKGMEDEYCPGYIGAYDKNGRHSWGFVDFETADATLPATLYCNGEVIESKGVSVCQAKKGLIQVVEFDHPVELSLNSGSVQN